MIWLLALLLVVWGNVLSTLLGSSTALPGGGWPFVGAGVALMGLSLIAARSFGLIFRDVFFATRGLLPGIAIGAGVGAAAAGVGVAGLRLVAPLIVGRAVEYAPLAQVTETDLVRHLAFFLPLGDILPEELAFRGVLLPALLHDMGTLRATVVSAAAFALWHTAVVFVTVGETTIGAPSPWSLPAVAGALVVVFAGGAVLAWLRVATGNLLTTVAAHWAFNAVVLAGLWSTRSTAPAGCC